jgi:hypothetical protein
MEGTETGNLVPPEVESEIDVSHSRIGVLQQEVAPNIFRSEDALLNR